MIKNKEHSNKLHFIFVKEMVILVNPWGMPSRSEVAVAKLGMMSGRRSGTLGTS